MSPKLDAGRDPKGVHDISSDDHEFDDIMNMRDAHWKVDMNQRCTAKAIPEKSISRQDKPNLKSTVRRAASEWKIIEKDDSTLHAQYKTRKLQFKHKGFEH